jgi:hypothetical protein
MVHVEDFTWQSMNSKEATPVPNMLPRGVFILFLVIIGSGDINLFLTSA